MGRTAFEVYQGEKRATEKLGSDHQFNPASAAADFLTACFR
jgi:hypothetical protein